MMKIISLGLGVQSTAMYFLSSVNMIERADHAVFADPGAELPRTYEILEMLQDWAKYNNGIPIHVTNERNLLQDIMKAQNSRGVRWASIPAFTESGGMIMRQCTGEYKIQPVIKKVRELHGLKPRQRMPKTEMWLGITLDEIQRMKISQLPRIDYIYPLIEQRMSRSDCMKTFKRFNFPIPPKSSCVFCPYHSDKNWKEIKEKLPEEWEKCVEIDNTIRDATKKGINDKLYLHRSLTSLEKVQFADQQELFMCEEGFCGL
tara:strand:- start:68 stop:847 length:780 start_codon:yes stop_codon:yes gene_type:complete